MPENKFLIPDDMWTLLTQDRPPGSPSAYVADAFNDVDWSNSIDATPGFSPEDLARQEQGGHLWSPSSSDELLNALALATRPAGVDAFMQTAPVSTNFEDRREQTPQELIAELMKFAGERDGPDDYGEDMIKSQGGYQPSEQLPVPSFDYRKRSR
jgi:hypothetical protein